MPSHNGSMSDLIAYLSERPNPDQVAQFLVLQSLRKYNPRDAVIYVFFSDGSVHAAGSFGFPLDSMEVMHRRSLWDKAPAIDAIRDGIPVVINLPVTKDNVKESVPTIAWPLTVGNQRVGSLQIRFSNNFDTDTLSETLAEISGVLGLYLAFHNALDGNHNVVSHPSGNGNNRNNGDSHKVTLDGLSIRQTKILKLLAQGLTNPQIAARIGYSDSTVRQETMAIYRHLGVNGRRDAVEAAMMRGLLDSANQMSVQS